MLVTVEVVKFTTEDRFENFPEAIAYSKQTLDVALQLRELRGVETACGVLSNVYADTGDDAETIFASLCAATLIKYLKIDNLPSSGADYGIFTSRIKGAIEKDKKNYGLLTNAESRVKEILVKLNGSSAESVGGFWLR